MRYIGAGSRTDPAEKTQTTVSVSMSFNMDAALQARFESAETVLAKDNIDVLKQGAQLKVVKKNHDDQKLEREICGQVRKRESKL